MQNPLSSWKDRVWDNNNKLIVYAYRFYFRYHLNGFLSLKFTKISYDTPIKIWKNRKMESILTVDADMFDETTLQTPMPFFSSF